MGKYFERKIQRIMGVKCCIRLFIGFSCIRYCKTYEINNLYKCFNCKIYNKYYKCFV